MQSSIKENLFDGIIEKMPDALIVTNELGIIEIVNNKVFDVFGYRPEELISKEIEVLIPKKYRDVHKVNVHNYFKNPVDKKMAAHRTVWGLRRNGTEFEIDITIASLIINNKTYAIASARDISDKKHLEEELKLENISLHMLNKGLEKYSYTVTHDLKTPLAKIEGLINLLIDEVSANKRPEDLTQIFHYLKSSVSSMRSLITNTLEDATHGKEEQNEKIHFMEIFDEMKNLILIPEKFKINVDCDSLILTGKKNQFIQIFLNLLSNAIKFNNKKEGIIEIHCHELDNEFQFSLYDNGIGIPNDRLEKIFNLFETGSENRNQSHGVGLSTVKSIVENRGGKIWASSKVGEWSKIEFTWPKLKM